VVANHDSSVPAARGVAYTLFGCARPRAAPPFARFFGSLAKTAAGTIQAPFARAVTDDEWSGGECKAHIELPNRPSP
jgi:hypothetical protein